MRTRKEIVNYLRSQSWYDKFRANIDGCIPRRIIKKLFKGELGEHTLCGGFDFTKTIEGEKYWKDRENEFLEWYDNGNK